jgi:4-hydroxy-4-methyl-2-oxoglutarate aldolase
LNIGFRVYTEISRPGREVVEMFQSAAVTNIADAMHGIGVMDSRIAPLYQGMRRVLGTAVTVDVTPGDGMMLRKALEVAREGDVLVVNSHGCLERAILGGNVCMAVRNKKLSGIIVDGAVRDIEEARALDVAVMASGVSARSGTTNGGWGEVNVAIACGGAVVNPGDIVVGDSEGVVVIPKHFAKDVFTALGRVEEKKGRPELLAQRLAESASKKSHGLSAVNEELLSRGATIIDGVVV